MNLAKLRKFQTLRFGKICIRETKKRFNFENFMKAISVKFGKENVPSNELSQSAATEAVVVKTDIPQKILPEQIEVAGVTPLIDENLFLKPKNEIFFCDYMLYWLESIRKNVAEDTFSGYSYAIKQRIYPYFKKNSLLWRIWKNTHF